MDNGFEIAKPMKGYYQKIICSDGVYYEIYDEDGFFVADCKECDMTLNGEKE